MTQTFTAIGPDQLDRYRHHPVLPQLVDCRSRGEFAAGHVPGSVNIPVEELAARLHDIDTAVTNTCAMGEVLMSMPWNRRRV